MDQTTDPTTRSFVDAGPDSHFPIQNLPLGVFTRKGHRAPHIGTAIGECILDLTLLEARGIIRVAGGERPFAQPNLNRFLSLGRTAWKAARQQVFHILRADTPTLRDDSELLETVLVARKDVSMALPVAIGDYTDFYSSKEHATNIGAMFRGKENALFPNWIHLPVGYHGRASSIVVSGTEIVRPAGQRKAGDGPPRFGPTKLLDFELETGFLVGPGNELGRAVKISEALDHIYGMVLVNDWSARDIQKWEYEPLGPFLGKSFATTISPWIVSLEALAPFRCIGPVQEPEPMSYLRTQGPQAFDIQLEVRLQGREMPEASTICRSNFKHLYWSMAQQLAHHTSNGCAVRPGDLMASGTISGPTPDSFGSMLELTQGGRNPISFANGETRRFLEDGDTVILTGWAQGDRYRIGFAEAAGRIVQNSEYRGS
jgi:fumarylacetoacetase